MAKRDEHLVLRKAAKALDTKNMEIALLRLEKRSLEQEIEDLRPKKKKKVAVEMGRRFVQIAQVSAVQQLSEVIRGNENTTGGKPEIDISDSFLS